MVNIKIIAISAGMFFGAITLSAAQNNGGAQQNMQNQNTVTTNTTQTDNLVPPQNQNTASDERPSYSHRFVIAYRFGDQQKTLILDGGKFFNLLV